MQLLIVDSVMLVVLIATVLVLSAITNLMVVLVLIMHLQQVKAKANTSEKET